MIARYSIFTVNNYFFFLVEYKRILFVSFIFILVFLGGSFIIFIFYIKVVFISFTYI